MSDMRDLIGRRVRFTIDPSGGSDYGEKPATLTFEAKVVDVQEAVFCIDPPYQTYGGNYSKQLPIAYVKGWEIVD